MAVDLGIVAALFAGLVFLAATFLTSSERKVPGPWAISWGLMIAVGLVLALDPAPIFRETARIGASLFPGLQLAGAYRYVDKAVPRWVFAVSALAAVTRSTVALLGYHEFSHASVLWIEMTLLAWSARIVLERSPEGREAMDRLLALGAISLCGLESMDAIYDVGMPDGSVMWAPWLVGGGFIGMIQIIGVSESAQRAALEKRRLREERERNTQRLESLGALAGGIAHDFNNLLTGVIGDLELALLELDEAHPARSNVENAVQASLATADLSGQMLSYAAGRRLEPQPVHLGELLRERSALLRSAVRTEVELQIDAPADLPLVLADPSQVDQLLMNLVINAGEACPEQGGRVLISVEVATIGEKLPATATGVLSPGRFLRLTVEDNGAGVGRDAGARLFDPFFSTKSVGRGLGLAVVHRIVLAHDGAAAVDSLPGRCAFSIYLPASEDLEREKSAAPAANASQRATILVVDDDLNVLRVASRALGDSGHEVIAASGGRMAVDLLREKSTQPSLLVLDATMPDVGARQVIATAQALRPGLPILMMTGHDTERLGEELVEPEIVGWLRKPFRLEALCTRVDECLNRQAPPAQGAQP